MLINESLIRRRKIFKKFFFSPTCLESLNLKKVFNEYLKTAAVAGRVIGAPRWRTEEGSINVIGIRQNHEIGFNDLGELFHNDLLVIVYNSTGGLSETYLFPCTMDPKGRKLKIAHLLEGVYASYTALRPHKWVPGRTAIVQDRDKVLVGRTDSDGILISTKPERGLFGINIHDSGGYQNSSLGCTVLEPDSDLNDYQFIKHFKPLLKKSLQNKSNIDYCVMNFDTFKYLSTTTFIDEGYLKTLCFRTKFLG